LDIGGVGGLLLYLANMILDNIQKTIDGDDFIGLPVALSMPYTNVICELTDVHFVDKFMRSQIRYFMQHSESCYSDMYLNIDRDCDLVEIIDKQTNEPHFRFYNID
jgi:hypothetical protein